MSDRKLRVAVTLGIPFVRMLSRTWRVREIGRASWNAARAAGRPAIICLWHGQMLALLPHHRDLGVNVLISEHGDGEIIARVAHAFGYRTVRGSTSRGAGRALLELVAALNRGEEIAITPDGPRGPRHEFAPGALVASQRAGAPIIGIVAHVDRAWRLKSWDRFEIPKPFAKITVVYSDAVAVEAATPREAAAQTERFAAMMNELGARAERESRG